MTLAAGRTGRGWGDRGCWKEKRQVSSCTQGAGTLDAFHRQTVLKAIASSQITITEQTPR